MATVFDAIEFAARAHAGQYRKGTRIPYILHPLSVARILIECNASDDIVIAAVLHDMVEDTKVTLADVRAQFGDKVAQLVKGMSEPNRSDTWENRKQATLDYLETAPQDVLLIEIADKLDNIRGMRQDFERDGAATWERFTRGYEKQKWYHERLVETFRRRINSECGARLAEEFEREVRAVFGSN